MQVAAARRSLPRTSVHSQRSGASAQAAPALPRAGSEAGARALIGAPSDPRPTARTTGLAAVLALRLPPRAPARVASFDWDDNIFRMPTKNWLFHGATGEAVGFGTAEWPAIRAQVGKPGPYQDHVIDARSFMEFQDDPAGSANMFLQHVEQVIDDPNGGFKGPSWDAFVEACSTVDGAARTTLITARMHAPASIHAALVRLVERGLIAHAPPVENLFPVAYPPLAAICGATPTDPSGGKAHVMCTLLDRLQAEARPGRTIQWGFSDDDHNNYAKAKAVLAPEVAKGRWPNVEITIHYTGEHEPGVQPHKIVLAT